MAHKTVRLLVLLATRLQASTIGLTYKEIQALFVDLGEPEPSERSIRRLLGNLKSIDHERAA